MDEIKVDPELEEHSNRMHDEIDARAGRELRLIRAFQVPTLLTAKLPLRAKWIRLRLIADHAMDLVKPNTPCRSGCSDCCYQAVPIPKSTAKHIAAVSGRSYDSRAGMPMDTPHAMARAVAHAEQMTEDLLQNPIPCPFLKEGHCSIYKARPITCRTHHVLHPDSSRCSLFKARDSGKPVPQVRYNLREIDEAAMILAHEETEPWADIREWFK